MVIADLDHLRASPEGTASPHVPPMNSTGRAYAVCLFFRPSAFAGFEDAPDMAMTRAYGSVSDSSGYGGGEKSEPARVPDESLSRRIWQQPTRDP